MIIFQIHSSRKLAHECKCNVEIMWLLSKLYPDFRNIFDYRKDNKDSIIKAIQFKKFNKFCMSLSKVKCLNSRTVLMGGFNK